MVNPDVVFILHALNEDHMPFICLLRLFPQQLDTVALDHGFAHRVDYISAYRAHIKPGLHHVCRHIPVGNPVAGNQLRHRDPECVRNGFQQGNVRVSLSGLPFGNRLVAHVQLLRQLQLGHILLQAQLPDSRAGHILVHCFLPPCGFDPPPFPAAVIIVAQGDPQYYLRKVESAFPNGGIPGVFPEIRNIPKNFLVFSGTFSPRLPSK